MLGDDRTMHGATDLTEPHKHMLLLRLASKLDRWVVGSLLGSQCLLLVASVRLHYLKRLRPRIELPRLAVQHVTIADKLEAV